MEDFDRHYNRALWYLQIRIRSEQEMVTYLRKKGATEDVVARILTRLRELRFVDDVAFARQFIESRLRSRPRSFAVLTLELRKKGIQKDIIEQVLPTKEAREQQDEASARELVERKFGRYKSLRREEQVNKLASLLSRRGYTWDIIRRVVDDVARDRV